MFLFLKIASTISHEKSSASAVNPPSQEIQLIYTAILQTFLSSHLTGNTLSFHYIHQHANTVWGEIAAYFRDLGKQVKHTTLT
jgi:hypothetical protein